MIRGELWPGTEALHIILYWLGGHGLGIAASGTMRKGTVGGKFHGPRIHPMLISLRILFSKNMQCLNTVIICVANHDIGVMLGA